MKTAVKTCLQRHSHYAIGTMVALMLASVFLRISLYGDFMRGDVETFVYYVKLMKAEGFVKSMSRDFTKLSSVFLYLWYPLTWMKIKIYVAIKIFSTFFDMVCAYWCYRIVRLQYPSAALRPWLAATLCMWLPTYIIVSGYWGQVDSTYVSFLLGCTYYLMRLHSENPGKHDSAYAIILFSCAFCFKLQSILFAPALCFLVGKRIIPLYYGFVPIIAYAALQIPRLIVGYPPVQLFSAYNKQLQHYTSISDWLPNPYVLVRLHGSEHSVHIADMIGMATGPLFAAYMLWLGWKYRYYVLRPVHILALCTAVSVITPYIVTRMHERYFHPACALLLLLAFFRHRTWHLPVILNGMLCLPFLRYLQNTDIAYNIDILGLRTFETLFLYISWVVFETAWICHKMLASAGPSGPHRG